MGDGTGRRRILAPWTLAWLALAPLALVRAGLLAESDTFWETRAGLLILNTARIPTVDPFSWTAYGLPWRLNSWAFDVLLGLGYRAGGLTGVALVGAATVMVVGAALLVLARSLGASALAAVLVVLVGMSMSAEWLSARPQLVDYAAVPLLLILFHLAVTAGGRRRVAAVLAVAAVQAVWVNLHAAATLGVGILVLAALGGLAESRLVRWLPGRFAPKRRRVGWRWYAAPAVAAFAGTLVNPFGADVFTQALRVRAASGYVAEWRPLRPTDWAQLLLLGFAVAAGLLAWRLGRLAVVAVLAGLAVGGILAIRLLPIAGLVALPVLATAFQLAGPGAWLAGKRRVFQAGCAVLVAAFTVLAAQAVTHLGRSAYPEAVIRALPAGCRLFNEYTVGGAVVLQRPDVPVGIDSRSDLYGMDRLRAYVTIERGEGDALAQLDRLDVTCVLIPGNAGLAGRLRGDAAWRETASAPTAVLFVRSVR